MSKGMTCSHVTRRETGELRVSHRKIPEKGWGVVTRLPRASDVILRIMDISYRKCNTTNHILTLNTALLTTVFSEL